MARAMTLPAQSVYMGLGYNASYYRMPNLDKLIDRYNSTRSWLTEQMRVSSFMRGPQILFGARNSGGLAFHFCWTGDAVKASASGLQPNGTEGSRYVKISANRGSAEGFLFSANGWGSGLGLDIGMLRTKSKTDESAGYRLLDRNINTGLSLIISFTGGTRFASLGFRAWYCFPFVKNYISGLGSELDGVNYYQFTTDDYSVRAVNFGFSVLLMLTKH